MAFSSEDPEVMLRVLVAVLHFDRVTGEVRLARSGDVAFVLLPCVAGIRTARWLPPLR